jgi:hypothetical protein
MTFLNYGINRCNTYFMLEEYIIINKKFMKDQSIIRKNHIGNVFFFFNGKNDSISIQSIIVQSIFFMYYFFVCCYQMLVISKERFWSALIKFNIFIYFIYILHCIIIALHSLLDCIHVIISFIFSNINNYIIIQKYSFSKINFLEWLRQLSVLVKKLSRHNKTRQDTVRRTYE